MMDTEVRAGRGFVLKVLAGTAVVAGAVIIAPSAIRLDLVGILLGVVLLGGGIYLFSRAGRSRRTR